MRLIRTKRTLKTALFVVCAALYNTSVAADYKEIIKDKFWGSLYKNGGETYFCKKSFSKKTPLLAVSHIYPSSEVRDHLDCGTKRQCLRSNDRYTQIISDLHNIVPADSYFEFKRKSARFGSLDESVAANDCGIRKKLHIIEPPDELKGDVARVLLYMHAQYDLPLQTHLSLLKLWHKNDPPSAEEISRNEQVAAIQGNENGFISNPALAYNLD